MTIHSTGERGLSRLFCRYSIDIADLHATCEGNYARLLRLFPDYETANSREFQLSTGDRVRIDVAQRCRYTTMMSVVQWGGAAPWLAPLRFELRAYHDARMAEVTRFQSSRGGRARYEYPNPGMHARDEKSQQNRFLGGVAEPLHGAGPQHRQARRAGGQPGRAMNPAPLRVDSVGGRLRLVQITDTHLYRDRGGTLVGLDTDYSLQHVLDRVRAEREAIDLVLGTGDISDHGNEEAYRRAREYFAQLGAPVLWLPGNHDDPGTMAEVLGDAGALVRAAQSPRWMVVMLNSQEPGEVGGHLGDGELSLLRECLADAEARSLHVLVCLHHQPVPMGSAWIDQQMVEDREALLDIVDGSGAVRGLLWGHVHQALDISRGEVRLMSTPSTCVQFAPLSEGFRIDDAPPGYRWLDLLDDGGIETGVSRVTGVAFDVDLESGGYL